MRMFTYAFFVIVEKYKAFKMHPEAVIQAAYSKYIHTTECHLAIKANADPYLSI